MSDAVTLMLAWTAGVALGALFFGGLWWTLQRGVSAARPALWFLASLLSRLGVTMLGFYLVGAGDWRRLSLCLIGFMMARALVTRLTRPLVETHDAP
jgi:F1F0 ATPase subunit 2